MKGKSHFLLHNYGRWTSSPGIIYNDDYVVGPVFHGNGLIFAFNLPYLPRYTVILPPHVTFHKSIDKYNPHDCAEGHVTYYVDDGRGSMVFQKVHCPDVGGVKLDRDKDVFTVELLKLFNVSPYKDKVNSDWGKDHVSFLVKEAAEYMYDKLSPTSGGGATHDEDKEDKDGDKAGSDDEDRDDGDKDRDVGLYDGDLYDGDDGKKDDGLDGDKNGPDYGILYENEEGNQTLFVSRDRGVLLDMSIEEVVDLLNQPDTTQAYPLAQTLDKLNSGTQRAAMVGAGARRKTGISAGTVVLGVFLVLSAFFAPVF